MKWKIMTAALLVLTLSTAVATTADAYPRWGHRGHYRSYGMAFRPFIPVPRIVVRPAPRYYNDYYNRGYYNRGYNRGYAGGYGYGYGYGGRCRPHYRRW